MTAGQQLPLGQPIPDSLHAVSMSIPTMADVIGYEEKTPEVMAKITSGYPRFVPHRFLREIEAHWKRLFDLPNHSFWLTSSEAMAKRLHAHLATRQAKFIKHRGVTGLRIPSDPAHDLKAKQFLQHTGGFLSTRQAEDYLVAEGLLPSAGEEAYAEGDPTQKITSYLSPLLGTDEPSIVLSNTGMNAFYSAFQAVRALQWERGRRSWIKIGWLYSDTMHILDKLSGEHAANVELLDIFDLDALEAVLEKRGHEIAGIVTEAPTNPLIQTMDLGRIRDLATKHRLFLIVDPTVASPANIDVAPFADIIVNSLTKYASNAGDVILGAVAVTKTCPHRDHILAAVRDTVERPYGRDLARLAYQISGYKPLIQAAGKSTAAVVEFLSSHPRVRRIFWTHEPSSRENYLKIARSPDAYGPLLSFEFDGPLERFYDAVPLPKGPTFGLTSTILCPYIYLAHYALVTSEQGRERLAHAGIDPELIRLSIGAEPADEIISALKTGLDS